MRIRLAELRSVVDRVFSHLEETGRTELDVDKDYYWFLPEDVVYEVSEDPGEADVGQLTHDWERLTTIRSGEGPPIGYALVWLSCILRFVGERFVD